MGLALVGTVKHFTKQLQQVTRQPEGCSTFYQHLVLSGLLILANMRGCGITVTHDGFNLHFPFD